MSADLFAVGAEADKSNVELASMNTGLEIVAYTASEEGFRGVVQRTHCDAVSLI